MKSFEQFFLEYRHNLADGTSAPSIQAHNGKNPNNINKKKMHTIGPYKPKEQDFHKPGTVIIGDNLLAMLIDYNIDFKEGGVAKIKNSDNALQMFKNPQGLPAAKVVMLR